MTNSVRAARAGRTPWTAIGVTVVLVFAAVVGVGLYRSQAPSGDGAVPPGATAAGVPIGDQDAPVTVDVYLDYQCPACARYEQVAGPVLDELVAAGRVRVVYHPVAYLDRLSSTRYSSRSSAAVGCVANDPEAFLAYQRALFAGQPPESADGLPADQLVALAEQAGGDGDVGSCVADERYADWTTALTDAASQAGVNATPTVLVDGQRVQNSPDALRAAVTAAD